MGDDITEKFFNKAMEHGVDALYQNAKEQLRDVTPNNVHEYKKKRASLINLKVLTVLAQDIALQHSCLRAVQNRFEQEGMPLQASIISDIARDYITPEPSQMKTVECRTEEVQTKIIHDLGKILQYAHTKMGLASQMPDPDLALQLASFDCAYNNRDQSPEALVNENNKKVSTLTLSDQVALAAKNYFSGDLQQLLNRLQHHVYTLHPQGNLHSYVYMLQVIAKRNELIAQIEQQNGLIKGQAVNLEDEKKKNNEWRWRQIGGSLVVGGTVTFLLEYIIKQMMSKVVTKP